MQTLTLKRWTLTTFWGWLTGIVMLLILSSTFDTLGIHDVQFIIGVGVGLGVGFAQGLVLKKAMNMDTRWLITSVAGLGIPFLVIDILALIFDIPWKDFRLPVSLLIASVVVGVMQARVLKQYVEDASDWIVRCALGWVTATATVLSIDYWRYIIHNNWVGFFVNLAMILGGGAVLGLVTGGWIVKKVANRSK